MKGLVRIGLLYLSLIISVVYLAFKHKGTSIGFLFSDEVLSHKQWVYFMAEHMVPIILAVSIILYEEKYKIAVWCFLLIHVVDTVDFSLTYAEPWTSGMVTFNTIKILTFFVVSILVLIQYYHERRRI